MKSKEKFELYVKICERAEKLGIYNGERITLLMDIENADLKFNLQLENLLNADNFNFAHDVIGIHNNIDRTTKDFGCFLPRFAS